MNISLGADPEIFLQDATARLVSAVGKVGGTKAKPKPLPIGKGFAVQEDNVAVEYNIPPSFSEKEFVSNINTAMKYLLKKMKAQGLSFNTDSAASFPEDQLKDDAARVFGCDPDFNAWTDGKRNPRPRADDPNLRSAGGHVHVGAKFEDEHDLHEFIKRCDLFLGVPSVILDPQGDKRRLLYGAPGSFRVKPFGCEYRTLSNFWIFDPKLTGWVWRNTVRALNDKVSLDHDKDLILAALLFSDASAANTLINKYSIDLV